MSTEQVDFSDFRVRCSAISCVLANSQSNPVITEKQTLRLIELEAKEKLTENMKGELADLLVKKSNVSKIILSDTCIGYLLDEYAWRTERKVRVTKEIMDVDQMQKGIFVEKDSLDLLSSVDKVQYNENRNQFGERERVNNEFLSGEVDAFAGKSIMEAEKIPDIKSIWDYPTFLCKTQEALTKPNDWQIKGYMDITSAPEGFVANCLIDTPMHIQEKIKSKLLNKLSGVVISEEDQLFKDDWTILEWSMRFSHIPSHQRVFKKAVTPMTAFEKQALYDRVKVCREWLNNFHEQYSKLNLP